MTCLGIFSYKKLTSLQKMTFRQLGFTCYNSWCNEVKVSVKLREQFKAANLKMDISRTIAESLREVAGVNGPVSELEMLFISNLISEDASVLPASFDQLWPFSKLFLSSCICLAVLDGNYSIEKARKISEFAHKLGFSAFQLAELEKEVIHELRINGTNMPEVRHIPKKKNPTSDKVTLLPPEQFLTEDVASLWNSDSELITGAKFGNLAGPKPD